MCNKSCRLFRLCILFIRMNFLYCRYYFPFFFLLAFINPLLILNFQQILQEFKPQFVPLHIKNLLPRDKIFILYVPTHGILTKMFNGIHHKKDVKSYLLDANAQPVIDSWLNQESYVYTHLYYNINNFTIIENVNINKLTETNISKTNYHVRTVSFSSSVINRYGFELSLSKDQKSSYLSLLYVMTCSIFSMYNGERVPEISITGLPNSLFYSLQWPYIQLMLYYLLFGCFVLHLKTIRRLSHKSVFPQTRWYSIVNYFSLAFLYHAISLFIHLFTSITLSTGFLNVKIVHNTPWYVLYFTFVINTNTLLMFGMVLCEMDMSSYNLLYFIAMLMTPQLLYIFSFGQSNGLNCYFQYLTCLSPLFAISWSLILLENMQAEYRFFISNVRLNEEFSQHCFSFVAVLCCQCFHNLFYLAVIFFINFSTKQVWAKRRRQMKKAKKRLNRKEKKKNKRFKNSKANKRRSMKKKRRRAESPDTTAASSDTVTNRPVLFPKSDYIISAKKVIKTIKFNGKQRKVLKSVSVKFRRNKVTTILGPNGSGKTTLLNVLSGVSTFNSGSVTINGKSVITNEAEAVNNINKYCNEIRVFGFLTVSEYFELVIQMNKSQNCDILHHRLTSFVETCDIQSYLNTLIKFCPLSIVQVVKIVCTFLTDKPIVILDDPMEGLDFVMMQNICALMEQQKPVKTIIYTSCNSDVIEYVSDCVIVLINGRKVSQTDIENFNLERMLYKLVCSMEPDTSDYTLTRYMKLTFPTIRYDETIDGVAYFSVPQMTINELWNLLSKLDRYGYKLGVWRYKFLTIGMRHFLSKAYDSYLKARKRERIIYSRFDILPQKIKETSLIYKKYFFLIMSQRIVTYCRFPNRLIMRFVIPLVMFLVWATTTSLSHPTVFVMDSGYQESVYKDELNDDHRVYICCKGKEIFCRRLFNQIRPAISFIKNVHYYTYDERRLDFRQFQQFLSDQSHHNYIKYNNLTLFAIYLDNTYNTLNQTIILTNDYRSQIFAYNYFQNIMISPKRIQIDVLKRIDLLVEKDIIDNHFLLLLIMVILLAYSITTYRHTSLSVQKQFFLIHKYARVNFSLLYIPYFIMDICLYILITCFMILIFYVLDDHDLTYSSDHFLDLLSVFCLFIMADSSFKLLFEYLTDYNPLVIFFLKFLDMFMVFYLNIIYFINYVINVQRFSYGVLTGLNTFFVIVDAILKAFVPSASLNAGLKLDHSNISNLNGIMFIQWIIYFALIFLWHYYKFKIKKVLKSLWCFNIPGKKNKPKNIGSENSFLFVKNISFFSNNRMYFENCSIEFQKGSVWGIIARNNSGKTHFLKIILGRTNPTSGGIYLYNELIKTLNIKKNRMKVGYCSEQKFYMPDLTVEETVMYWSRIKLIPEYALKNFVHEILHIMLLAEEHQTLVQDLSLPSIKKLNIAIAIIGFPDIIILDDPLSSLDSLARQGVITLIERAKSNNCTVLIAASEISELRHTMTHIAILSDKKLEYSGPFVDAIGESKLGYYLTIFISDEYLPKRVGDKLSSLIEMSFKNSFLFKLYEFHLIYFIPFQTLADPNTTKILLFMETIKDKYKLQRFMIKYDVIFPHSES